MVPVRGFANGWTLPFFGVRGKIRRQNLAYTPTQACLRFEATESRYLLVAYGIKDDQAVAQRPDLATHFDVGRLAIAMDDPPARGRPRADVLAKRLTVDQGICPSAIAPVYVERADTVSVAAAGGESGR